MLDEYSNAVSQYRKAMNLDDAWQSTKQVGAQVLGKIATGAGLGGAYAIARKYLP